MNPSFTDYKMTTVLEMPAIESIIVESNDPDWPFGAKEAAEGAVAPVAPAILNAIYDATEIRFHELPLTAEKILRALKDKGK